MPPATTAAPGYCFALATIRSCKPLRRRPVATDWLRVRPVLDAGFRPSPRAIRAGALACSARKPIAAAACPIARADVFSPPVFAPVFPCMTFSAGPARRNSRGSATRLHSSGPVQLADSPTSASGGGTDDARQIGRQQRENLLAALGPLSSVAPITTASACAAPVTHGLSPSSKNPSAVSSARNTGFAKCRRLVVRCEMPTVVKCDPSSNCGSQRRASDSLSESTIRRQADVNWVRMNVVVKQAALSFKYPRNTSASLHPNPPTDSGTNQRNTPAQAQRANCSAGQAGRNPAKPIAPQVHGTILPIGADRGRWCRRLFLWPRHNHLLM